jgi:hypothetical protein
MGLGQGAPRDHLRSQPEAPVGAAAQIAEADQRGGEPQDRALVKAGLPGQLGQRQRRPAGAEGFEDGQGALDRLDPLFRHPRSA